MALVITAAMLPSMTLSNVDGMPKGRKLSAVRPIFAFGIHAWTEQGGGTADLQISLRCVIIASDDTPGWIRHAA